MSFQITNAFIQQFSENLEHLAQQMSARLPALMRNENVNGESAYFDQLAPRTARKAQSRHGDTPFNGQQHLRRRVTTYLYDDGDMIDKVDKLRMITDPTSDVTRAIAGALSRAQDDECIAAFFGTAYTGHAGGTTVTWPNGNAESSPTAPAGKQVAVNAWNYGTGTGNSGLTVSKLIEARTALRAAEGDDEEMYICVTARQEGNLLATTEATSLDYNEKPVMVDGKIDRFMGFKFIHSERLVTNASGYRRVPAWRAPGMLFGTTQAIQGVVGQDPSKKFNYRLYGSEVIGATRMQESMIAEIICSEA